MDNNKKFIAPTMELVDFVNDDIITLSSVEKNGVWKDDDNSEPWGFLG